MSIDVGGILGIIGFTILAAGLVALWGSALVSILNRSRSMSGLELLGWCALILFAQFFGPLIWFFVGRDRYPASPSRN